MQWIPLVGTEALRVLENLIPETSRQHVRKEAVQVLSSCVPPKSEGRRTGLVVGYVQSGKTMSFTAVSALAHDNGYQLVVVITGTSKPLFRQSVDRLSRDLSLLDRHSRWRHFTTDNLDESSSRRIRSALSRWKDPEVPEQERHTVIVTALKNKFHLDALVEVFSSVDLSRVPTLIIDDEADQASLNIEVGRGDESKIYGRLVKLRSMLPSHTFLQYTATPQAPLLINIIDVLSPDFCVVLTPGQDYVGGKDFFGSELRLVRVIPPAEIFPSDDEPLGPPDSLLEAMRIFFLGVAAEMARGGASDNRSMLVHPSKRTLQHAFYERWAREVINLWERVLSLPENARDRVDLLTDFGEAYRDLKGAVEDLPAFSDLVRKLPRVLREADVKEVNTREGSPTRSIEWPSQDATIVVGGQALERGYTVPGLTVSYMPRGKGIGNADTIQQRARWFGYKADYLGYCRVYLAHDTLDALRAYSVHEEDMREQLKKHQEQGLPLKEWKRALILGRELSPTRRSVLDLDYMRGDYSNSWFIPERPHADADAVAENRTVLNEFLSELAFTNFGGGSRLAYKHLVADLPLRQVQEGLLSRFRFPDSQDSNRYLGFLLQVQHRLDEKPDEVVSVIQMSPEALRQRSTDEKDRIVRIPQGRSSAGSESYPGDRAIKRDGQLTVQIHRITAFRGDIKDNIIIGQDVPAILAWVPGSYSVPWLVQERPRESGRSV